MGKTVRDPEARKVLTQQRRARKLSDRNKIDQRPSRDARASRPSRVTHLT